MTEPLKVLDCFSGIGGFALAESFFEEQFETKQFVEINPYCQQVLSKNFKGVPIHDDIKTFTAPRGSFDIATFGFPCQDISIGGQQKGIGEGTRSGLFYECIRLLREIRPQFAIFENVRNLLSIEEGKVFQEVLFQIAQAGYDAEWSVVSARDVGGCHLRERVWIIAYPNHKRLEGLRGEHELQESCGEEKARWSTQPYTLRPDWQRYDSQPCLPRRNDGLPKKLDTNWRNRKERIQCLGNAVTPQQAAIPLGRIIDLIKS